MYEKDGQLYARSVVASLRLNFSGHISIVASEGAIEIGKVFDAPIYVSHKAGALGPFSIPAWHVKPFRKKADKGKETAEAVAPVCAATAEVEPPAKKPKRAKAKAKVGAPTTNPATEQPSLRISHHQMQINVKEVKGYFGLKTMLPDTITLQLPCLLPEVWAAGLNDVLLNRPSMTTMSKATCAKKADQQEQIRSTQAKHVEKTEQGSGSVACIRTNDKQQKHLSL